MERASIMQRGDSIRAGIARALCAPLCAVSLVLLFSGSSGSSCSVGYSYCSDDCDPCLQNCRCRNRRCDQQLSVNFEDARKLTTYELALVAEPDGRTTRIYSRIVGLSIERALGKSTYDSQDLRAFAESVIAVNADLFRLAGGDARWVFESLDVFDTAEVATYRASGSRSSAGRTLTILFDRRGNLVEIDDACP